MVSHDFSDSVVLITGALGGIGMATAEAFARGQAKLLLADLKQADEDQIRKLKDHGAPAVTAVTCDISSGPAITGMVSKALDDFGKIDVIVNIAGAMIYCPVSEMTGEDWRRTLDINLVGPALLVGAGLAQMESGGAIVNVASIHARQTTSEVVGYAAAKAGMCSLTRTAAIEGQERGIRVNSVLPGAVDTTMLWNSPTIKLGQEKLAASDVGKTQNIADAICFLASGDAKFINGQEIVVDGGRLAKLN